MLFTSLDFFLFLPLVLAVFALTPVAQRWAVLLLASYVFYGFAQPFNLIYLGAVTLVVFACGWGLARTEQRHLRVAVFVIGLVAVLGSLTAFKFYDFLAGEIAHAKLLAGITLPRLGVTAPAGYSFYAFSAASYLIDIYVGRLSGRQSLGQVALFTAYFPKIFAGPIERAPNFLPQVLSGLRADPVRAPAGLLDRIMQKARQSDATKDESKPDDTPPTPPKGSALILALCLCGGLALLAAEAVRDGAGSRRLDRLGGVIHGMPVSAAAMLAALVGLSAPPPSLGFAALWLIAQSAMSAPRA